MDRDYRNEWSYSVGGGYDLENRRWSHLVNRREYIGSVGAHVLLMIAGVIALLVMAAA